MGKSKDSQIQFNINFIKNFRENDLPGMKIFSHKNILIGNEAPGQSQDKKIFPTQN